MTPKPSPIRQYRPPAPPIPRGPFSTMASAYRAGRTDQRIEDERTMRRDADGLRMAACISVGITAGVVVFVALLMTT